MSPTVRSRVLTAAVVAMAVILWYALTSGRVERARTSCTDRGGQVTLDLDERGVSYVQWCVLPDGTRERI